MAAIHLEVVTPERVVLQQDVDIVVTRAAEGDIGILHGHEPLITPLSYGELMYRIDGQPQHMAIFGGFMEVRPDKVTVLADSAERSEEIDREQAEAARRRAEELLAEQRGTELEAQAAAALQRALLRLHIAERRRRHEGPPRTQSPVGG